jgi:hypothetical protein
MATILEVRHYRKQQTDAYLRSILLSYENKLLSEYLFA